MSHTLTFTDEQLQVLSAALGALPYTTAAPLIADINAQLVAAQQKDASAPDSS